MYYKIANNATQPSQILDSYFEDVLRKLMSSVKEVLLLCNVCK